MFENRDDLVRAIMQAFPGWRCFYGSRTGKWWGVPPPRHPVQVLFEADTAEELAARIHRARTAPHHPHDLQQGAPTGAAAPSRATHRYDPVRARLST